MAGKRARVRVRRDDGDVGGRRNVGREECGEEDKVVGGRVGGRSDAEGVGVVGAQDLVVDEGVASGGRELVSRCIEDGRWGHTR